MSGGYENLPDDPLEVLSRRVQSTEARVAELERPTGGQVRTFATDQVATNVTATTAGSTSGTLSGLGPTVTFTMPYDGRVMLYAAADLTQTIVGTGSGTVNVAADVRHAGGASLSIKIVKRWYTGPASSFSGLVTGMKSYPLSKGEYSLTLDWEYTLTAASTSATFDVATQYFMAQVLEG